MYWSVLDPLGLVPAHETKLLIMHLDISATTFTGTSTNRIYPLPIDRHPHYLHYGNYFDYCKPSRSIAQFSLSTVSIHLNHVSCPPACQSICDSPTILKAARNSPQQSLIWQIAGWQPLKLPCPWA